MLGGALGSQYLGGLYPCEMCYWQRWPHGAAIVLAALAFTAPAESPRSRTLTLLAALAIAISGAIGVYHAGVEAKIFEGFTTCTALATGGSTAELLKQITHAPLIRCDQVQFRFLGISLAGWNAILSLGGAALILLLDLEGAARDDRLAARRPARRHAIRCCASTRPANMARRGFMPASSPCFARNCPEAKLIARMAAQEERHLDRFNALMAERRVRPTALQPLWNVAGFALGAVDRADVGESRAGLHRRGRDRDRPPLWPAARPSLATRIPSLPPTSPNFAPTSSSIAIRRARRGATEAIGYPLLTAAIRAGCRVAIALSKRI